MKWTSKVLAFSLVLSVLSGVCLALNAETTTASYGRNAGLENFKKQNNFYVDTFNDVRPEDWFYEEVETAYQYGLMIGISSDMFSPHGDVTLAETVTLAARLHSIYHTGSCTLENGTPWYQNYLDYAKSAGIIITEYDDYNRAATRAEYAAILFAAFPTKELKEINKVSDGSIPDVKKDDPYAAAVYALYRAGVLTGTDGTGTFLPYRSISRSEVAAIASRMAIPDARIQKSGSAVSTSDLLSGGGIFTEEGTPAENGEVADPAPTSVPDTSKKVEPAIYGPCFILQTVHANLGAKDVPVTVALKNNPGIASVGLTVSYDGALTLKDIVYNNEIGGTYTLPPTMGNPAKLIWLSALTDVSGDWVLATMYFDVAEDASAGVHQIAAVFDPDDVFNMTMENIPFEVINGSICIAQ